MSLEGCDCSEFERREGFISCEDLMTGQVSSLKGKLMSPDLVEMDQKEYEVIKIEEADLRAVKEKEWQNVNQPRRRTYYMVLVASIVGVFASAFLSNPLAAFLFGIGGGLTLIALTLSDESNIAQVHKIHDIDDNRLARLRNKGDVLEAKIPAAKEFKEEFRSARDFFKTKYDLFLGLRHRPVSNVSTVVLPFYSKA